MRQNVMGRNGTIPAIGIGIVYYRPKNALFLVFIFKKIIGVFDFFLGAVRYYKSIQITHNFKKPSGLRGASIKWMGILLITSIHSLAGVNLKEYTKPSFIIDEVKKRYDLEIAKKKNKLVLYQQILLWEGTPYQYGGNSKSGIDCSSLVAQLYSKAYKRNIFSPSAVLYRDAVKVKRSDLKEGDLVFFRIESKDISHVGVYLQDGKFVHASTKKGVIVSSLSEEYYKKYFIAGGRI